MCMMKGLWCVTRQLLPRCFCCGNVRGTALPTFCSSDTYTCPKVLVVRVLQVQVIPATVRVRRAITLLVLSIAVIQVLAPMAPPRAHLTTQSTMTRILRTLWQRCMTRTRCWVCSPKRPMRSTGSALTLESDPLIANCHAPIPRRQRQQQQMPT